MAGTKRVWRIATVDAANIEQERKREFVRRAIKKFRLNLEGLTVFTEAATGNYKYTPIIAALAGAKHVFAFTANSKYGEKEEVKKQTLKEAEEIGVTNKLSVIFDKDASCLCKSDIITNSGFVRPITREMISFMKPTAVIPLMWETWEFRPEDLDLTACEEKGILVMGTDEHHPSLNLFRSIGFKICKLLFDAGFSVYQDNLLLVASGDYGDSIADFFINNGISFDRLVLDNRASQRQESFIRTHEEVIRHLGKYEVLIVAEMYNNVDILSAQGLIPTGLLRRVNPLIQIIFVCGAVGSDDIAKEGLAMYPPDVTPFGHIRISAEYLGWKPTLELITAGLRVGEVMVRSRLLGMSTSETISVALRNSPAQAFEEGSFDTSE